MNLLSYSTSSKSALILKICVSKEPVKFNQCRGNLIFSTIFFAISLKQQLGRCDLTFWVFERQKWMDVYKNTPRPVLLLQISIFHVHITHVTFFTSRHINTFSTFSPRSSILHLVGKISRQKCHIGENIALWVRLNVKWEIGKCLPCPSF